MSQKRMASSTPAVRPTRKPMLGCPTIDPPTAPAMMLIARMKPAAWADRVG